MARKSDALLAWLRKIVDTKGSSVADLAARAGLDRARLRKVLRGAEPMLLDELLAISEVLEIQPSDFGMPADTELADELPPSPAPAPTAADPWGNHPEQVFRFAFDLGCDFYFQVDTTQLATSGVPKPVLDAHPRELGIKLDAAYHKYNAPRYDDRALTLTLSFDALYDCTFPWSSVRQVVLWPAPPEAVTDSAPEPEPAPTKKGSHLRLVT